MRRAEFAVAAFGLTAFLLALIFALDAVRFHGDVLVAALQGLPRGEVQIRGVLLISLALFDLYAVVRAVCSISQGVSAHRRVGARMPVVEARAVAGHDVLVVPSARPMAFCSGLWRPRVYVSTAAVERLGADELAAVVTHEAHHAERRDPLRILVARAIGDAYSLGALPRREQALAELAADAAVVRSRGAAPLASALLAFDAAEIAPERVDRLAGEEPRDEVPRALVAGAGAVIAGLLILLALGVLVHGHPRVCLPLASAPVWWVCAVTARFAAMGPAWLGWRRAGAFLT
ncbi:MAG TPA: M48 family metalloprotease [Solirubrobacter sp.]